jgi:AcrR family transcriptional regulator
MTERMAAKAEMQERILQVTDRLFYRQGIRAVGVDTVAAEVGISKRTLYNYYPSKDALIAAYLSRRFRPVALTDAPPLEQILGNFDRLERSFASEGFRGCPFVNAVAELKEPGHAANEIAIAFKDARRAWFRTLLARLDVADPDALAGQLMLLSDGAITTAVVRGDPAAARMARNAAVTLLRAAGVEIPTAARPKKKKG